MFEALEKQMAASLHGGRGLAFLEDFVDRFGSRFAGSEAERGAASYLAETFEAFGYPGVALEPFACTGWSRNTTEFSVLAPKEQDLDCIALPNCPPGQIEGPLVYLGDGHPRSFAEQATEIGGAIVMITSRVPSGLGRTMSRTEKIACAMKAGARGIVWMRDAPGGLAETGTAQFGEDVSPIAVAVSFETGHRLLRLARKGTVRIRIRSTNESRSVTSSNVVAEMPGTVAPEEVIVVGAHYDGHDIGQGAMDNGAGVAALTEAMRALAPHRNSLRRTVRFVAFAQEEMGLRGACHHAARHTDEPIRFMLNHDAGCRGIEALLKLHGWPEDLPFMRSLCREMNDTDIHTDDEIALHMDSYPFAAAGIPCATLMTRTMTPGAQPGASRGFGHTAMDTLDKVNGRYIQIDALRLACLALRLAGLEELPFQRKTPHDIGQLLARQGLDAALRLEGREVPGD